MTDDPLINDLEARVQALELVLKNLAELAAKGDPVHYAGLLLLAEEAAEAADQDARRNGDPAGVAKRVHDLALRILKRGKIPTVLPKLGAPPHRL